MSESIRWQALPSEILQLVTELGGWDATLARTMSQVCRSWRTCILLNEYSLSNLMFSNLNFCLQKEIYTIGSLANKYKISFIDTQVH